MYANRVLDAREEEELTRISRAVHNGSHTKSDERRRVYRKRNAGVKLGISSDEVRPCKKRISDRLKENYRFKFRYSFTIYTELSQKVLINTVFKEFPNER